MVAQSNECIQVPETWLLSVRSFRRCIKRQDNKVLRAIAAALRTLNLWFYSDILSFLFTMFLKETAFLFCLEFKSNVIDQSLVYR